MAKKILIITPRSPFTNTGACEQDRLSGIEWFIKHGFEVRVITKAYESDLQTINEFQKRFSIKVTPVAYRYASLRGVKKVLSVFGRLFWPPYWDGASFEYFDSETQRVVKSEVNDFNPDYAWFDYTYLWPLYGILRKKGIPVITRSINFESTHFLDEDGRNPLNYIRAFPKLVSEYITYLKSDYLFSITPKEENIYRRFGKSPVKNLPLRSLPKIVEIERNATQHDGIRIGFMPSTYNVHHNREALRFLVEKVMPSLLPSVSKNLTLHVTGSKFPKDMEGKMPPQVIYEGFVPSPIQFWQGMDIAVAPSIFGAGMQQKIFEPISLGVPTITSRRGIAGYDFECGKMVYCAETKDEVCSAIEDLVTNKEKMKEMSLSGKHRAKELFSQNVIDKTLQDAFLYLDNLK